MSLPHKEPLQDVVFFPDGKRIATVGDDRVIRIWDAEEGRELSKITGHTKFILNLAIAPDGQTLLSGAQDGTARLWDVNTGMETYRINALGEGSSPIVAISPDGQLAAITDYEENRGNVIRIWNLKTREEMRRILVNKHFVDLGIPVFSSDSKALAINSISRNPEREPHRIIIWDLVTGNEIRSIVPHANPSNIDLSPDGRRVLAALDEGAATWEIATGKELRRVKIRSWMFSGIYVVKYSPDGRYFYAAGARVLATLRDSETLKQVQEFNGNGSAAFSPDGKLLAMVRLFIAGDYSIKIWRLEP